MAQTIQPVQILVLDNASTDNSIENVGRFENISILKSDKNLGFAAGNNLALDECNSEFIALLNPDAFPEPGWLENLLMAATANPDVSAFGSRQLQQSNPDYLDGLRGIRPDRIPGAPPGSRPGVVGYLALPSHERRRGELPRHRGRTGGEI